MCGIWSCVFPVAFALTFPAQVLVVALRSVAEVAAFSPISRFLALVFEFFWSCLGISRLRLNFLAALVVLPFSSICLSYASTVACGCWPCGFSLRASSLVVPACVCRSFLGGGAVSSFSYCSAWGRLLLSLLLVLLLCLFLWRLRFSAACPAAGYP